MVADVVEFFYEFPDILLYFFFDDFESGEIKVKGFLLAGQISEDVFVVLRAKRKQILGVYLLFQLDILLYC